MKFVHLFLAIFFMSAAPLFAHPRMKYDLKFVDQNGQPMSDVRVVSSIIKPGPSEARLAKESVVVDSSYSSAIKENCLLWKVLVGRSGFVPFELSLDFAKPDAYVVREKDLLTYKRTLVFLPEGDDFPTFQFPSVPSKLYATDSKVTILLFEEIDGNVVASKDTQTSSTLQPFLDSSKARLRLAMSPRPNTSVKTREVLGSIHTLSLPNIDGEIVLEGGKRGDGFILADYDPQAIRPAVPASVSEAPSSGYKRRIVLPSHIYAEGYQYFYIRLFGFYGKGALSVECYPDEPPRIIVTGFRLAFNSSKGARDLRGSVD